MAEKIYKDLTGKRFGTWTVTEECIDRFQGSKMIMCKCDCGTVRRCYKSPFLHGRNSETCSDCNLNKQKKSPIATLKKEKYETSW